MRRGQNRTTNITLRSERSSVFKKDLTGPTLLEMSGYRVYRDLGDYFRFADNPDGSWVKEWGWAAS
jgi:hypothetical protein